MNSGANSRNIKDNLDFGYFSFASKDEVLEKSKVFWNPHKTQFWSDSGVPLVIDRREGYFLYDVSGRRLIDVHLNGGTYNLGHRNCEIISAITGAMTHFDIGNHHFPALARTALAERLIASAPAGMTNVIYGSGGAEAIDISLKTARHATQRKKIVSVIKAYHGHTGLALATGDERYSKLFLSEGSEDFIQVPFNDLGAMAEVLKNSDVASVIMETIPATYGFPLPNPGYLEGVKSLCEEYGSVYIADEVQTGLMRTGELWGVTKHNFAPDMIVTAKGLSGGMYPISAVIVNERSAKWLSEDGFGHISTFGGSEIGCVAAIVALDICSREATRLSVHHIADVIGCGLRRIQENNADWLIGIRQNGLVIGLEFNHPEGAKFVMKHLYELGVWAIFSSLDPRVLQYKPGLLMDPLLVEELLERTALAISNARAEVLELGNLV